jgi:aminoglycoside phosphotransferase (APT) family kinase protein
VLLLECGETSYVCHLSLNLGWIRDLESAHHLASRHGVPVPRVVASGTTVAAILRYGTGFVLREHVGGERCDAACPPMVLRKVANTYASLHSIGSERWGPPRASRRQGPEPLVERLQAWETTVRDVHALAQAACTGGSDAAYRNLLRLRPAGGHGDRYRLVHGDCNINNILVDGNGNVCLIDLERLHFGLPALETVHLLLQLCGTDAGRWREFLAAYLERLDSRGGEAWERHAAFWIAGGLLNRIAWHLSRSRLALRSGDTEQHSWRLQTAARYWQDVQKILDTSSSRTYHWTDAAGAVWAETYRETKSAV